MRDHKSDSAVESHGKAVPTTAMSYSAAASTSSAAAANPPTTTTAGAVSGMYYPLPYELSQAFTALALAPDYLNEKAPFVVIASQQLQAFYAQIPGVIQAFINAQLTTPNAEKFLKALMRCGFVDAIFPTTQSSFRQSFLTQAVSKPHKINYSAALYAAIVANEIKEIVNKEKNFFCLSNIEIQKIMAGYRILLPDNALQEFFVDVGRMVGYRRIMQNYRQTEEAFTAAEVENDKSPSTASSLYKKCISLCPAEEKTDYTLLGFYRYLQLVCANRLGNYFADINDDDKAKVYFQKVCELYTILKNSGSSDIQRIHGFYHDAVCGLMLLNKQDGDLAVVTSSSAPPTMAASGNRYSHFATTAAAAASGPSASPSKKRPAPAPTR